MTYRDCAEQTRGSCWETEFCCGAFVLMVTQDVIITLGAEEWSCVFRAGRTKLGDFDHKLHTTIIRDFVVLAHGHGTSCVLRCAFGPRWAVQRSDDDVIGKQH